MAIIIGLSGKKQSGKSSLATYLKAYFELKFLGVNLPLYQPEDISFHKSSAGNDGHQVFVVDSDSNKENKLTPWEEIREKYYSPDQVKIYSFADPIKEFCIDVLGIKPEQVYGTDEQKNVPTEFRWENFPTNFRPIISSRTEIVASPMEYVTDTQVVNEYKKGPMTAREIMQVFGTDIMRNMFSPMVWVNACIRKIQKDNPKIAIIADLRFPSELEAVEQAGGYIVRLERKPFKDNHPSETSLDNVDWATVPSAYVVSPSANMGQKNNMVREWIDGIMAAKENK
jgi:hypothetical protein